MKSAFEIAERVSDLSAIIGLLVIARSSAEALGADELAESLERVETQARRELQEQGVLVQN